MTHPRPVRVRFAPSPTGHLHVGGARTAIFNWLFAKSHDGSFILRIEDTDQQRSTRESEAMVLDDLRWLDLHWDEGPEAGGIHGPYRQSERMEIYGGMARELLQSGRAYHCFCDEEMLERKRKESEEAKQPPHYDLTCWKLGPEERRQKAEAGDKSVVRFHVPKEAGASFDGDVHIDDLIRGEIVWKKESLGDFILLRSDGMPTYNFSVVVDDHLMEISHVIRAEEHLTNTHRQVLIYRAMNWPVPEFAHVSLILGEDRTKLSKRHGATSVSQYAEDGFLPAAMLNYLALLGWSPPDGKEIFTATEAIAHFSLDRVNAAPAVFDAQKLLWMNGQYLRQMPSSTLRRQISRELEMADLVTGGGAAAEEWLDEAVDLVQKGADKMSQLRPALMFLFHFDAAAAVTDPEISPLIADSDTRIVIDALHRDLSERGGPVTAEEYQALAERVKIASGAQGKKLFMPIRVAVTGSLHGPELARTFPLLEKGSRTPGIARVLSPLERVEAFRAALG
ncbi:MAG TPA: glutamate--tRNA ligase [Thermoanaerobaculia bacterium]|nr:glutamate--tRNA ligase [Thermoanaerobaculia bacterium]